MVKILKDYSWMYDIVRAVANGEKVPIDEINLVGGRKSGKSKSVQILFTLLALLPPNCKVGLIAIRCGNDNADELFEDIKATLDMLDVSYQKSKSDLEFRFKSGKKIRVIGLNSMSSYAAKKSGLATFGDVDYIFKYYEERFEFSEVDYLAVQEAIRGWGNKTQMITINVCNPWAKSNEYIQYCTKYMEWNINLLKEKGNQIGIFDVVDDETKITTRKLFQYTNWRVAQEVLSKSDIAEIRKTWDIDRNRAITTDWGLPGYEWGAIYTHLLNKVGTPILQQEPTHIIAGMDFGWSANASGGKTACVFGVASRENGIDIYGEYVQDPAIKPMSPDAVARQVVEFFYNQMKEYCYKVGRELPYLCKVKVDNMVVGMIQILNNTSRNLGFSNWLTFQQCRKFPILDRIDIQQAIMGHQMFRVDESCKNLMRELELAHYKDNIQKREREKGSDHTLNAYEYGLETIMYSIAKDLLRDRVFKKAGTIW